MNILETLTRMISRFRHPVSLPEDIAQSLGIHLTNNISFEELIHLLKTPECRPTKLRKFMSRDKAESAFQSALRKESFKTTTFFSYYFNKGWVVFVLHFDPENKLRRLYLQCPHSMKEDGFEIFLEVEFSYLFVPA